VESGVPESRCERVQGLDTYRGTAQFSGGSVRIQNYEEFDASMQTRFRIENGRVLLEHINLQSEGASSDVTGYVDFKNFPTCCST
jgi:hypothetical protein